MLEIEKKLNTVVNLPQVCTGCKEDITKKNGTNGDSLCFHSVDDDHNNWVWGNKVPMHNRCHLAYHSLKEKTDRHIKANATRLSFMPYNNDEERVLYVIGRLHSNGIEATKTKIMQQTAWLKDKTGNILDKMVAENTIKRVVAYSSSRRYVHYEEVE